MLDFPWDEHYFPQLLIIHTSASFPPLVFFFTMYKGERGSWAHFAKIAFVCWLRLLQDTCIFLLVFLLNDQALEASLWNTVAVAFGLYIARTLNCVLVTSFWNIFSGNQRACQQIFNSRCSSSKIAILFLKSRSLECSHSRRSLNL